MKNHILLRDKSISSIPPKLVMSLNNSKFKSKKSCMSQLPKSNKLPHGHFKAISTVVFAYVAMLADAGSTSKLLISLLSHVQVHPCRLRSTPSSHNMRTTKHDRRTEPTQKALSSCRDLLKHTNVICYHNKPCEIFQLFPVLIDHGVRLPPRVPC